MGEYFKFWWLCVKWSYWRWEGREPMIASALFILVSIGGAIGAFIAKEWWIFLIPLGVLIIFIAPYKLWKREQDTLVNIQKQLQPKLVLSIEHEPVETGGNSPIGSRGRFWRIKVENNSLSPLNRCYGVIDYCYAIDENGKQQNTDIVRKGHPLPWARQTSGITQSSGWWEATIGITPIYLDYIMIQNEQMEHLNIPSRQNPSEDRPEFREFKVPFNKLAFKIMVASYESPNSPSTITFQFDWQGGFKTTIKETE